MSSITDRFVRQLNQAFETITQPDGTPYTPEDVMVETRQAISGSYLRRLRAGHITNPTIQVIGALSSFFRVPPSYFLDESVEIPDTAQGQMDEVVALLAELTPLELEAVIDHIAIIKKLRQK